MQRLSFYQVIHKGVRAMVLDLVADSGRVDWADRGSVAAFRTSLQNAFALLAAHAAHEEEFIAPLLETNAVSAARVIGGAHRGQDTELQNLLLMLDGIEAGPSDAPEKGHKFVVALSRFAGESLVHMADEEEIAMPALWQALDDARLLDTHQRVLAAIPPDEMASWLRWLVPSINIAERMQLLGAMTAAK